MFAALNVLTGEVFARCHRRHRHQEFLRFLNQIDKEIPEEKDIQIHIVMDNYGTHKVDKVKRWFARRPRLVVHFTPTGSSWINQIERCRASLTVERIRRGSFTSIQDLEKSIHAYLRTYNENPKPYIWTATAESIFQKVEEVVI